MSKDLEAGITTIKASLVVVGDQLKASAEQAITDQKLNKDMTDEVKASIDSLLTKQSELKARLDDSEQALIEASKVGSGSAVSLSMGQEVAASEAWANFNKNGSVKIGVKAAITGSNVLVQPDRLAGIVSQGLQRLTIRDLLMGGNTESNSVEFAREVAFVNNAAPTAENTLKPESDITFELAVANVATIAHWIPASKQVLADNKMLASYIDSRLQYGVKVKEESQLLKGDGTGVNLNGLFTQASAFALPVGATAATTSIDRIRNAILQAELADYYSDGIVLNPIDWANIEKLKDTTGAYLFGNPHVMTPPALWGRNVVSTTSLAQDEFLTGAFGSAAQIFDREDVSVTVSTENSDNFVKNMCTLLGEERIALAVYRTEAFVKGSLTIV